LTLTHRTDPIGCFETVFKGGDVGGAGAAVLLLGYYFSIGGGSCAGAAFFAGRDGCSKNKEYSGTEYESFHDRMVHVCLIRI
jgi:hypothetical protein